MSESFWANRRVLVTGHTGFKGSWLSLWLSSLGADVTGFALPPKTGPSLFSLASVDRRIRSVLGDVRDPAALRAVVSKTRPEVVFHLAAQALVRTSYLEPIATYETNVMGTAHLLDALRSSDDLRAVVIVTTDKCYENREWLWGYREHDPLGGHDPYASSKACAELVTAAFRSSFFSASGSVGISTARAGNVIGGGDWADYRLIPDVVTAFASDRPVDIRYPDAVRPWQHVLDPLAGYLLLAERLFHAPTQFAEGWNFGPADDDARPVSWIVDRLATLWGTGSSWATAPGQHVHEAANLRLDCSKARARLHWRPKLDLGAALEWVVEWYKCFNAGGDVSALTDSQISRYRRLERQ